MLTNNEIILFRRAVDKAVANGWKPDTLEAMTWAFDPLPGQQLQTGVDFIFTHDFAMCLWGTKPHYRYDGDTLDNPAEWQYQLQQMVISDDPIKYIGENYNDVN